MTGLFDVLPDRRVSASIRSLEDEMVRQATAAAERGPVYVVAGTDSSQEFRARVAAVCPLLVDERAENFVVVMDGSPDEWLAAR